MSGKQVNPIVRAVTARLWARDRAQMRVVDALLSAFEPKRPQVKWPRRRRKVKQAR